MKKPLVITDIDDCCLSWIDGFRMYMSRILKRDIVGYPNSWSMGEWLGISEEEVWKHIKLFNTEPEFGMLPATANAVHNLRALKEKEHDIIAVTCCDTNPMTVALRKVNLHHVFGKIFSDVVCLPLGMDKTEALKIYLDNNVVCWVEDKPEAAMAGKNLGYHSFLIRCAHNREYEKNNPTHLNYVDCWNDIRTHLVKEKTNDAKQTPRPSKKGIHQG